MSGRSDDAGNRLARVISATFGTFRGSARVEHVASTPWASVTFSGARHHLRVVLEGDGAVGTAADFLAAMPELDLSVPDQIVADIALLAEARHDSGRFACVELEALTIDDD